MTTGVYSGLWDVLPCTNQEKYVCKHLAEGAVLTAAPPTFAPPKCADGWKPVGTRSLCAKVRPYDGKKTSYIFNDFRSKESRTD